MRRTQNHHVPQLRQTRFISGKLNEEWPMWALENAKRFSMLLQIQPQEQA